MDFWGYYGAFILGKDNPIQFHIIKIKELWHSGSSISEILLNIYHANITNKNYFFLLNILPSLFGLYHFSTSNIYGILNYILVIILITLNYVLIKNIFNNLKILYLRKDNFYLLLKIFLIYFILFFVYLVLNLQLWPSIKLYFVLSPIFFILVCFKFTKNDYPAYRFIMLFLLILLLFINVRI